MKNLKSIMIEIFLNFSDFLSNPKVSFNKIGIKKIIYLLEKMKNKKLFKT